MVRTIIDGVPVGGKYADPLSDFGFKVLFGREANKAFLIAFLNDLLKGRKQIVDLKYTRTELHGPQSGYRRSVFDVSCITAQGEQFLIEMQRTYQDCYKDRAVYYTAAYLHELAPRGIRDWDYQLQEVILVSILNFGFADTGPDHYYHWVQLTDADSQRVFYPKLAYVFIELKKFTKTEAQLTTDLDRWLYLLRHMGALEEIPQALQQGIFPSVFAVAAISNLSKEDYMRVTRAMKERWDAYAVRTSAVNEGKREGREEGLKEGKLNGLQEGLQEGLKEGELKAKSAIIKSLLAENFPLARICKLTGVTRDFVRRVKMGLA
ncbi:MAG: Rpn family recombination-promoting nuclease/putative transposase [Candidatus Pseudobacter hemicellulosilyticus]|uniref:Rpn family recombination-promoting nuclease/putative transposase n=1 Tax=Candidatus Pseudobacter hemicellulosilyticus TaxID=3121375 RepID=A0AAJ5WSQ5_9BACT|nr:MAG: Rpn family recombination-promoting nuclease/putative transposase [Pseudobacter sp.]